MTSAKPARLAAATYDREDPVLRGREGHGDVVVAEERQYPRQNCRGNAPSPSIPPKRQQQHRHLNQQHRRVLAAVANAEQPGVGSIEAFAVQGDCCAPGRHDGMSARTAAHTQPDN